MQPFEILDHTADLSLRAYGRDLRELIENAAAGLLALLYAGPPPAATATRDLSVTADRPEFVLQRALREFLYLMEDEGLAPVTVAVLNAGETSATLRAGVVRSGRRPAVSGGGDQSGHAPRPGDHRRVRWAFRHPGLRRLTLDGGM